MGGGGYPQLKHLLFRQNELLLSDKNKEWQCMVANSMLLYVKNTEYPPPPASHTHTHTHIDYYYFNFIIFSFFLLSLFIFLLFAIAAPLCLPPSSVHIRFAFLCLLFAKMISAGAVLIEFSWKYYFMFEMKSNTWNKNNLLLIFHYIIESDVKKGSEISSKW